MYSPLNQNKERVLLDQVNTFNASWARFEKNLDKVADYIEGRRVRRYKDFSRFVEALETDSLLMRGSYAKVQELREEDSLKKVTLESARKVMNFFFGVGGVLVVCAKGKENLDPLAGKDLECDLSSQLKELEGRSNFVTQADRVCRKLRKMEGKMTQRKGERESLARLKRAGFRRPKRLVRNDSFSSVSSGDVDSPLPASVDTDELWVNR